MNKESQYAKCYVLKCRLYVFTCRTTFNTSCIEYLLGKNRSLNALVFESGRIKSSSSYEWVVNCVDSVTGITGNFNPWFWSGGNVGSGIDQHNKLRTWATNVDMHAPVQISNSVTFCSQIKVSKRQLSQEFQTNPQSSIMLGSWLFAYFFHSWYHIFLNRSIGPCKWSLLAYTISLGPSHKVTNIGTSSKSRYKL